jgi:thiol-disulfide isomerase/thioredoxin
MKNIIFILILVINSQVSAQKIVTITGVIKGFGNGIVYLGNKPEGISNGFMPAIYDSVNVHNDSFEFNKLKFKEINFYSLEYHGYKGWLPFLIDTGHIIIVTKKDSLYLGKVSGSKENKVLKEFERKIEQPYYAKNSRFFDSTDKYRNNDTVRYQHYISIIDSSFAEFLKQQKNFIRQHPDKYVSLHILAEYFKQYVADSLKFYFDLLSPELQQNSAAIDIKYRITSFSEKMKAGAKVPDFSLVAADGTKNSLYQIHAKYKLINFWASWCGPCIAEIPTLKNIEKEFKNVSIISYSIDTKKNQWVNATKKNKISWYSFSDLKGMSAYFPRYFSVQEIPLLFC